MNHENAHKTKKRPEIALQVGLEKKTQGLPTDSFFLYKSRKVYLFIKKFVCRHLLRFEQFMIIYDAFYGFVRLLAVSSPDCSLQTAT